jgi:hypothetical protein
VRCGVHPRVEDAGDPYRRRKHAVEDDVSTDPEMAQTGCDIVSGRTELGMRLETTDGLVQPPGILLLLALAPAVEGVIEERLQVGLGFRRELEPTA